MKVEAGFYPSTVSCKFTPTEFEFLEAAGGVKLPEKARQELEEICNGILERASFDVTRPKVRRIKKSEKSGVRDLLTDLSLSAKNADSAIRAVCDSSQEAEAARALLGGGAKAEKLLSGIWSKIGEIKIASDKALERLEFYEVNDKRGRKAEAGFPDMTTMRNFVHCIADLYVSVGGKANISGNEYTKIRRKSKFLDFIELILKKLTPDYEPETGKSSLAEQVKRMLKERKTGQWRMEGKPT